MDFFSGLGDTLLNGVSKAIDGEVLQKYGTYGGQVVADKMGNTAPAGKPFAEPNTLAAIQQNPVMLVLVVGGVLLALVVLKKVL